MTKELVNEKVAKQNGSRDAIRRRALTSCCKLTAFAQLHPLQIGRGRSEECPLLVERVRERVFHNNSDTPQSLINDKGLFALKHVAFTLAEVLVTLGVIGIVAAMTIPNLVQSYKKKVVETRLLQFYSIMNQAVKLSEIDHGEEFSWLLLNSSKTCLMPYSIEEYFNEYLAPYLKSAKTEVKDMKALDGTTHPFINVYFANGSAVAITNQSTKDREPHFLFFPFGSITEECNGGIDCFLFLQNLQQSTSASVLYQHGVQPYSWSNNLWATVTDKDEIDKILREDTTRGCNNLQNDRGYCTAVIMRNGWKIPEDYPFKF